MFLHFRGRFGLGLTTSSTGHLRNPSNNIPCFSQCGPALRIATTRVDIQSAIQCREKCLWSLRHRRHGMTIHADFANNQYPIHSCSIQCEKTCEPCKPIIMREWVGGYGFVWSQDPLNVQQDRHAMVSQARPTRTSQFQAPSSLTTLLSTWMCSWG